MNLAQVLFYAMAFIAVASALYVAATKNLVRGIFMFFVTLFALAGLYVLAVADFVAVTQVVIYVGGILVLILFAFMLSGKDTLNSLGEQKDKLISSGKIPGIILAVLFFAAMVAMILKMDADKLGWIKQAIAADNIIKPTDNGLNNIGINLMTTYLLPFEAISILLMMALIGAAHISRKEPDA
ncbi:NADH-quinone oxidoreductase subunit J family protein [Mucilaginibacter sp. HD30]